MRHLFRPRGLLRLGFWTLCVGAWTATAPVSEGAELERRLIDPAQVEALDHQQFALVLGHHRGSVVVVNLWATWCIPCVQELPELDLLQERYRDRGLRVLAVSLDDPDLLEKRVRGFFKDKAPHLVSYLSTEDSFAFVAPLTADWLGALPTTIFIDRKGEVRAVETGRLLYQAVEERVLGLLAEPER